MYGETKILSMSVMKTGWDEVAHPAMTIPMRRNKLLAPYPISLDSLASTILKSAVKRFRILPKGTVSSHLKGVRKITKLSLSNILLDARIEPVKM